ncbi:metalloregulator ArsR/SmtB family transcription factor [Shimazuella sp. AN120528]|uniref:ArsR/SmtB family transcription factor n=1 Tax=Shimazuella soli TaxID=1892854 RepID=UPI001F102D6A|nr:metalloregulator ArsR/SmtB family transcription factor [Shimazuella soli]MCH5584398.1 metalloregulator ArsR/SmtB family transcription factor [Shimazuella soli]
MSEFHSSIANDCCDVTIIHDDVVADVRSKQLSQEKGKDLALLFQALSDPTRIRIIHTLIHREICVCDLAAILEMTQSSISHQLKTLRTLRLVKHRKVGRMVYYSIDDEHILNLMEIGLEHISHSK